LAAKTQNFNLRIMINASKVGVHEAWKVGNKCLRAHMRVSNTRRTGLVHLQLKFNSL